jgi:selenide,water dikinase
VLRGLPKPADPNVLVGTDTADDAGVYRLSDEVALVQTLDFFPPVVDDPVTYGQIAAVNALSDIYAMGGRPLTALNLAGFPDNELPLEILGKIMAGGAAKCQEAGCVIIGGHTVRDKEIKYGLAVTGLVHPKEIWTNAAAQPGDMLILTKPLGTGFVTTAAKKLACPAETLEPALASMATLNRSAAQACRAVGGIHSVTDITGFGLAGHAFEMAQGSGVTVEIHLQRLPLFPGVLELVKGGFFTRASKSNRSFVAAGMGLEPEADPLLVEMIFDAQTSGGLFISVAADHAEALVGELKRRGCPAANVVGMVVGRRGDMALIVRG